MKFETTPDGLMVASGNPDGYWVSLPARQKPAVAVAGEIVGKPGVDLVEGEVGLAKGQHAETPVQAAIDGGVVPADHEPMRRKLRVEDEDGRFCPKLTFSLCMMLRQIFEASQKRPGSFVALNWNDGAWILHESFEGGHAGDCACAAPAGNEEVAA